MHLIKVLATLSLKNKLRPIKFGGRVLSKSELNYDTTTKELLAIYFCVKQNEVYLMNSNFTVCFDYKPFIVCFESI